MRIERLLNDCWSAQSPVNLTKKSIENSLIFYRKYLGEKIPNLSNNDQLNLMTVYLRMIGYDDQVLYKDEKIIKLSYKMPGQIQLKGVAILYNIYEVSQNKLASEYSNPDFTIIFDFRAKMSRIRFLSNSKTIRVNLKDTVRVFGLVLVITLYRLLERNFEQKLDMEKWFFEIVEKKWSTTRNELSDLENKWNSFSESKIERRSTYK